MSIDEIITLIEQRQRELAGMRDYQEDYLERRRARGICTATDVVMKGHVGTLEATTDLLEALKAILSSEENKQ